MKNFKNKVVVIPGGATGVGLAFAKAFGKNSDWIEPAYSKANEALAQRVANSSK